MNTSLTKHLNDKRLARVQLHLDRLIQPSIRLVPMELDSNELKMGESRIGGWPDLPQQMKWPKWGRNPLAFLAQIRLKDLAKLPAAQVLPSTGWLLFFYDAEHSAWGFDPKDRQSFAVVYVKEEGSLLKRREVEIETEYVSGSYPCFKLKAQECLTIASPHSFNVERLKLTKDEFLAYEALVDAVQRKLPKTPSHQLLGYPQQIQNDMQLECQLVTNGLYCGNATGYEDARANRLAPHSKNWRLLFQLDSDSDYDMLWGDMGRLYFWITDRNLKELRFDQSWMILQCG